MHMCITMERQTHPRSQFRHVCVWRSRFIFSGKSRVRRACVLCCLFFFFCRLRDVSSLRTCLRDPLFFFLKSFEYLVFLLSERNDPDVGSSVSQRFHGYRCVLPCSWSVLFLFFGFVPPLWIDTVGNVYGPCLSNCLPLRSAIYVCLIFTRCHRDTRQRCRRRARCCVSWVIGFPVIPVFFKMFVTCSCFLSGLARGAGNQHCPLLSTVGLFSGSTPTLTSSAVEGCCCVRPPPCLQQMTVHGIRLGGKPVLQDFPSPFHASNSDGTFNV